MLFGGCRKVSVLAYNSDIDPMLEGSSSYTAVHMNAEQRFGRGVKVLW